jgi:diguanylate cyclase (GGDEF)-like protein
MQFPRPPQIVRSQARYTLAVAVVLAVLLLARSLSIGAEAKLALVFASVALIAWRFGLGPGIIGALIVSAAGVLLTPGGLDPPLMAYRFALIFLSLGFVVVLIAWLVTIRRREGLQLAKLAFYDPLTRLPNRSLFMDRLAQATARSSRHGRMIAMLFLDLDDFKLVNDRFGHPAGDALLAAVGERLRNVVRASDTVARLGGDEFALLLEDLSDRDAARIVAKRVIDVLGYPLLFGGNRLESAVSIGIAYASGGDPGAEELLHLADAALYQAKRGSKGWFREAPDRAMPEGLGAAEA